jgi:hypothetical protein
MDRKIVRKNLYLDEETANYIEQYKREHHLRFFSVALLTIIDEQKRLSKLPTPEILEGIHENNMLLQEAVNLLEKR